MIEPESNSPADQLHRSAVVVDAHHDLLMLVAFEHTAGNTDTFRQRWIPELRAGGIDVQVLPVFVSEEGPEAVLRNALQMIDAFHVETEKNPDSVSFCRTRSDLDEAIETGRIALILALEGSEAIRADLRVLRVFHRLGLRMMSLTWNNRTLLADGTDESSTNGRLTKAGVAAIAEMERLGIILDVSHLSDAGFWHACEITTKTFIASHSNCRAVFDHPRGLTDAQLRAIAGQGGVVGMNLHPMLVRGEDATVEDCLDHLEHALNVAGEDHVGLGPDFCRELDELGPIIDPPVANGIKGLERSADLPGFTEAMLDRGLGEPLVKKILGGNFLRVLREVLPEGPS